MNMKAVQESIKKDQVCPQCQNKMDITDYMFSLYHKICISCWDNITDHLMVEVNEQLKEDHESDQD